MYIVINVVFHWFFDKFYFYIMSDRKKMQFILYYKDDYIWIGDGIKYYHWILDQNMDGYDFYVFWEWVWCLCPDMPW